MMYKIAEIIFVLCLVLLSIGCSPKQATGALENRTIVSSNQAELTNYVEIYPADQNQKYKLQSGVLFINGDDHLENNVIKGRYYWTFASRSQFSEKFVLVILYDYQQVQFKADGQISEAQIIEAKPVGEKLKHPFNPENTEEASHLDFEFTVAPRAGRHMISFLLFTFTENVAEYKRPEFQRAQMMNAVAIAVIVNQNSTIGQIYSDTPDDEQAVDQNYGLSGSVIINKDPKTFTTPWFNEVINKNSPSLDYYIHLGNAQKEPYPYLLLAFLDWKQVPLRDGKVAFGSILDGLERQTIRGSVTSPEKAAVLVVVLVSNPYNHGFDGDTGEWVSFSESNRVLIADQ